MRQLLSFAVLVVTVGFICSEVKSEKAQQVGEDPRTFVVRYKNGDQTIPVTVVLDYKKQTEYVINMNPRTPAKSVTLYDFKQRTIAYKDLKNRECFLGRLTYETLKEETDALNKIKSPVDHKPKMLTLDPQKAALTPTEIRNIAGQRTAVFCRKMNTWLVKPQDSHSIHKRETDDEELEERTYHRHGFHTVRYSHYGRETRRRIKNSRRNGSKQSLYDKKNTSNNTSHQPGTSDKDSLFEEKFPSFQTSHHTFHHPGIGQDTPLASSNGFPHDIPESSLPHSIVSNHYGVPNEHGYQHHPEDAEESHQHRITERTPNEHRYSPHSGPFDYPPFSGSARSNHTNNAGRPSSALYSRSPVFTEDTLEPRNFPEPSFHSPDDFGSSGARNAQHGQKRGLAPFPENRQIESEWSPNETSPLYIPRTYPQIPHSLDVPENPDVSTNVLEVPKITKKFENIDHNPASPVVVSQPNEDVHDLFEGFYNLRGKAPENIHLSNTHINGNSYEPYLPYPVINQDSNLVHPNVRNIPSLSLNREFNQTNPNEHLRGRALPYPSTNTIATTESPHSFTLRYEPPTRIPHTNSFPSLRRYEDPNAVRVSSYDELSGHNYGGIHQPTFSPNFIYNPPSNTLPPPSYYTTVPPPVYFATPAPNRFTEPNQRSDIPSEVDNGDNFGSNVHRRTDSPLGRQNNPRPFQPPRGNAHHVRDPLSGYKPDEIVINLGDLPTERSLVAGFQDRGIVRTDPPTRKPTTVPTTTERREQISGGTWRLSHQSNSRQTSRRPVVHNRQHPTRGRTYHQRKPFVMGQPPQPVNTYQRRVHTTGYEQPRATFHQPPPYPIDALPPGVSIHPRHPQAPYADMFHQPNIPPPPPPPSEHGYKITKAHRQRHFRKKNRLTNCCRNVNGKGNCCRNNNGGSCCNGEAPGSCCSNGNRGPVIIPRRNPLPPNFPPAEVAASDGRHVYRTNEYKPPSQAEQRPLNDGRFSAPRLFPPNDAPQPPRRTFEDNKERCLKEKMCRTVYESTQQVIVCRNVNVVGC